ncbi:MAG: NAD(+) synthase [Clostridiales bacterium]|nr:NAD(+) synthase [Clostridiales bacterium]
MKNGFLRVGAVTPKLRVADIDYNADEIIASVNNADESCALLVFPELCVTGKTCGDLFRQRSFIDAAWEAMYRIADETSEKNVVFIIGLPAYIEGKLLDLAVVIHQGTVLGCNVKLTLSEEEARYFSPYEVSGSFYDEYFDDEIAFGQPLYFCERDLFSFSVIFHEDLMAPISDDVDAALSGCHILAVLSSCATTIGSSEKTAQILTAQSRKLHAAYVYANCGVGESTTDNVFAGEDFIFENGRQLEKSERFSDGTIYADIDLELLHGERMRDTSWRTDFANSTADAELDIIGFEMELPDDLDLIRKVAKNPFIPEDKEEIRSRCAQILDMQAMALVTRMRHIHSEKLILGLSGGLDSTLAILVSAKAIDILGLPKTNLHAVTMPCFGTTSRTKNNSITLAKALGARIDEISIKDSVLQHFKDIGHDPDNHNAAYENAQARERTQLLMDMGNDENGFVVGTGDLSELALGWATYNGDHMSMYAVNGSLPKTLIRHIVAFEAERVEASNPELSSVLKDILDTPVSPELLPPTEDGKISQKTEDLVGPYELHDFFLYYFFRLGFAPSKIYRLAKIAFAGEYDDATIYKWEENFLRRFIAQQFKRSCMPDGPKIGSVDLSPRGDLKLPSDAASKVFLDELKTVLES